MLRSLGVALATGFGLGLSPVASGTVGALLGIPLVYAMSCLPLAGQVAAALALVLVAIPVCQAGENHYGTKDDGRIVADEYLSFPLCMLGLPLVPWVLAMAFLTSRVLDIIKPPPAMQFQKLRGGLGIVADDAMSTLYALLLNHILYAVLVRAGQLST